MPDTAAGTSPGHAAARDHDLQGIDIAGLTRDERYSLMNQVVLPRPIAWVSIKTGSTPGSICPSSLMLSR